MEHLCHPFPTIGAGPECCGVGAIYHDLDLGFGLHLIMPVHADMGPQNEDVGLIILEAGKGPNPIVAVAKAVWS